LRGLVAPLYPLDIPIITFYCAVFTVIIIAVAVVTVIIAVNINVDVDIIDVVASVSAAVIIYSVLIKNNSK